MSRLEPLPPYPVFSREPQRNNGLLIITLIIVTIIFAAICLVVYAVFRNRDTVLVTRCEPGLCVVTLATGEKRCPNNDTEQLTYSTIFEDCTSGNYCQSERAPCAVLAGGVLNCKGVCGGGNELCRCEAAPS
jgi:hypothetical protein